jgi:hypothetical protein
MADIDKPTALANIDSMIIARALKKAIKNGYDLGQGDPDKLVEYAQFLIDEGVVMAVLVQHKFCYALWGDEVKYYPTQAELNKDYRGAIAGKMYSITNAGWQHHLQQMVIADNPIEYLAKNI